MSFAINKQKGRYYFFCDKDRKNYYQQMLKTTIHEIIFFNSINLLVKEIISNPPSALLIDIPSSIRVGLEHMSFFNNLPVIWPIVRCNITTNGFAFATCDSPPRRDPLPAALNAIARGDESWSSKNFTRKYLRLDLGCRIKIKKEDQNIWRRGNTLNISAGGFFAVTYDPPEKGSIVEIELQDLAKTPIICKGKTMWSRSWESTSKLPGVGIALLDSADNIEFKDALRQPRVIRHFIQGNMF